MQEPAQLWYLALLFATAVYGGLAAALLRNRQGPGSRAAGSLLLAVATWIAAAVWEQAAPSLDGFYLAQKIKYTAIACIPSLYFLFFLSYAGRVGIRRWHVAGLFLVPLATTLLVWTNAWHQLVWAHPSLGPNGERLVRVNAGPWYWRVHVPYGYLLFAVTLGAMAVELRGQSKLYRSQVALLLVATLIPLVTNALFVAGFGSSRLGPTPVALAVSAPLFAWGFIRLHLFRLSPVAYRAVFQHMRDGVVVVDRFDRVVDLNPVALAMLGRPAAAVVGHCVEDVVPSWRAALAEVDGAPVACEAADGSALELSASPIQASRGAQSGRVVLLRDVTQRRRAEAALRESEALVRSLVEHSPNGILRLRPVRGPEADIKDFECTFANPAAAAYIGRPQAELVGQPFRGAVHPHTAALFQAFSEVMRTGATGDLERPIARRGKEDWFRFVAVKIGDDLSVTFFDVTERRRREREIEAAASQDPLTGLLNRRGFEADAPALLQAPDGEARSCALLYVDLDGFKEVNDRHGHDAGDALLREIAARLGRCTRGPDLLARIGGDEFVLLLLDAGTDGALWVAERILAEAHEPVPVGERALVCAASVGIALSPEHAGDLKALLQAADRAMYQAKSRGGGIEMARRSAG